VYVHVPGTDNARRTKKLETRDVNEAIKQAMDFEKNVKAENNKIVVTRQEGKHDEKDNIPYLLVHAIARYSAWLRNENVPEHLQQERSEDYVQDIERKLKLLIQCLDHKGYDLNSFRVDQINNETVGHVFSFLKNERNFSARTFNKHFSYYTSFLKWFTEEYYPVKSWFMRVDKMPTGSDPEAITKDEYEALLNKVTPENGIEKYDTGVKEVRNFYRPFLKRAFSLALLTGARREELIKMKFNCIKRDEENRGHIRIEDFKINHIQKRKTEKDKKYKKIPLTKSLCELLDEMGYKDFKGTDNYILAPEIKSRGEAMCDLLSRSFTHYYKQLNTGRHLTFKSFRKAYITALSVYTRGANVMDYTGHKNERTIEQHYKDKSVIAKSLWDFEVFSAESERNNELEQVRSKSLTKQKGLEIEQ
jgi:integrase